MPFLPDVDFASCDSTEPADQSKAASVRQTKDSFTPASPHLPLVISSFTRPARPPPILNPRRLTIYTQSGAPQILGRGTFGVVYPGMLDAVCPVAIKLLRPRPLRSNTIPVSRESARDAASRHARLAKLQFRREIRRYASLRTAPGVVRFYGLVGKDMFVIERLFGGALNTIIRNPKTDTLLSPQCTLRIATLLANAVADLHRRGMSHGDLKPSNVLLSEPLSRFDGVVTDAVHVKLVDFGLSRRFQPPNDDADETYDFEHDDFDSERAPESTSSHAKVAQSVQLAARRYSCPISRPLLLENSDSELSDNDDARTKKSQSDSTDRSDTAFDMDKLSDGNGPQGSSNPGSIDEENSTSKHPLLAFPKDARGTPAYLSPEGWCGPSALRHRQIALKSDVYALAMILYELETGIVPWYSMSEWSIFVAVSNNGQRPPWPPEHERVSGLRHLVEQSWSQSHRDRPTCRQLAQRLQSLLQNSVNCTNVSPNENNSTVLLNNAISEVHEHNRNDPSCSVRQPCDSYDLCKSNTVNPKFGTKVEYTTPPASTSSFGSGHVLSEKLSSFARTQHDQLTSPLSLKYPPQPGPTISLTPPSSPARTSSHPSPGMHTLRTATPSRNEPSQSSMFGTVQQEQLTDFSLRTQPIFEGQGSSDALPDPNSRESSIQRYAVKGRTDISCGEPSEAPVSFHKDSLIVPQRVAQKYIDTRSSTANPITSREMGNGQGWQSSESANGSVPVSVRSLEYPYKDLVLKDDCASLCSLLSQHERNPKEATAVLEALGVLLDDSQPNCTLVATGGTLGLLSSILSRYGPNDSRLCKSVCVIILRLASSRNSTVEMKLRVTSACDMVLNCMRWHAADLPVIQNGACTLNALCRLSPALRSIFVSQGGPSTAFRALARAETTFNRDVLVACVALEVLSETAKDHAHALLSNEMLTGLFSHCDAFNHHRIDEIFIEMLNSMMRVLPESRETIICVPNCLSIISRLVERNQGITNWVVLFRDTCEIVALLAKSSHRSRATAAVLESSIIEAVIESLEKMSDVEGAANFPAGATGLLCLYYLSGLGGDVCGSLQMSNVFDVTRKLVAWAPNNRAVASHATFLILNVLNQVKGNGKLINMDVIVDMLSEMQEKWQHDTTILETAGHAIGLVREAAPSAEKVKTKDSKRDGGRQATFSMADAPATRRGRLFGRKK